MEQMTERFRFGDQAKRSKTGSLMTRRPDPGRTELKVAELEEQIDAYRDPSTSLALNDLQPTGDRR